MCICLLFCLESISIQFKIFKISVTSHPSLDRRWHSPIGNATNKYLYCFIIISYKYYIHYHWLWNYLTCNLTLIWIGLKLSFCYRQTRATAIAKDLKLSHAQSITIATKQSIRSIHEESMVMVTPGKCTP